MPKATRLTPLTSRPPTFLQCGAFKLSLEQPLVMGVVNVTPDSFSDGGLYAGTEQAVAHARRLIEEGADILDIGGESTRPGSAAVALEDERRRVLPVLEALAGCGVPVSVDTRKPGLMAEVIAAGADMVNDVTALSAPAALEAVAPAPVAVCLMHMRGEPGTMQENPAYQDVVREVRDFLAQRVAAAERAGIARGRIVADPGFGFGKTVEHNLALLRSLAEFGSLGVALMAGLSRKAMLGTLTGREPRARVHASVAAALLAVQNGAHIVRVHDVAATRDALAVWNAVKGSESGAKPQRRKAIEE
jgi:dihydropteroate synthase